MNVGKEVTLLLYPFLPKQEESLLPYLQGDPPNRGDSISCHQQHHIPRIPLKPSPRRNYLSYLDDSYVETPDGEKLDELFQLQTYSQYKQSQLGKEGQQKTLLGRMIRSLFDTLIELDKDPQPMYTAFFTILGISGVLCVVFLWLLNCFGCECLCGRSGPPTRRATGMLLEDFDEDYEPSSLIPEIPEAKRSSTQSQVDESDKQVFVPEISPMPYESGDESDKPDFVLDNKFFEEETKGKKNGSRFDFDF